MTSRAFRKIYLHSVQWSTQGIETAVLSYDRSCLSININKFISGLGMARLHKSLLFT